MSRIRYGSITILFAVIIICVSVLAVLSIATVRTDNSLAEKFADETTSTYELEDKAYESIAELDGYLSDEISALPENTSISEDSAVLTVENGKKQIMVSLRINSDNTLSILSWKEEALWSEDDELTVLE